MTDGLRHFHPGLMTFVERRNWEIVVVGPFQDVGDVRQQARTVQSCPGAAEDKTAEAPRSRQA